MEHELLQQMDVLYQTYLDTVSKIRKNSPMADGLLGFGGALRTSACHEDFSEGMQALLQKAAQEGVSPETAQAALSLLIEKAVQNTSDQSVSVMLPAVQNYGAPLIPFLSPEQAAALAVRYEQVYPRLQQLPTQQQFFNALLLRAGKAAPPKKRFLPFWH